MAIIEQIKLHRPPKEHGLDRTVIKYIAIAFMLLDHIAVLFCPRDSALYYIFRTLGRITVPVMTLFVVEAFFHTASKKNYVIRLSIFAVISQFAFIFFRYGTILTYRFFTEYNILFTLLLCFAAIACYEYVRSVPLKLLCIFGVSVLGYFCDTGIYAIAIALVIYLFRGQKNKQAIGYSIIALLVVILDVIYLAAIGDAWYKNLWELGLFLFLPLLYLYNGEPGSKAPFHKWFFYLFYPAHLAALAAISLLV